MFRTLEIEVQKACFLTNFASKLQQLAQALSAQISHASPHCQCLHELYWSLLNNRYHDLLAVLVSWLSLSYLVFENLEERATLIKNNKQN